MQKFNKKIIFFSRDLKIGGMEKALVILLNNLCTKNYEITLALENNVGQLKSELNPNIKILEYKLSKSKIPIIRKAINFSHRLLWSLKNKNKYDFSCNYATYMTIGSKLAALASKNSSLYVHSDYYNYFSKNDTLVKQFFLEQGIRELNKLIFVSHESLEPIKKLFPEYVDKFTVISNLVDYKSILPLSQHSIDEAKPNRELIVFIGRLEEASKRVSRLIEAFKLACEKSKDYELWIIGNGPYYEEYKKLVKKYSLENQIKLLGEKNNPYPYIALADCVIMTSDFEGFPVTYNECITLKTPIISTIPVSDDFINICDFSIITEKSVNEIAAAILNKEYKELAYTSPDFEKINTLRTKKLENIILN